MDEISVYEGVEITKAKRYFLDPSDYGFKLFSGNGEDKGSSWRKGKYILIRLSSTLWVCKKEIKLEVKDGVHNIKSYLGGA